VRYVVILLPGKVPAPIHNLHRSRHLSTTPHTHPTNTHTPASLSNSFRERKHAYTVRRTEELGRSGGDDGRLDIDGSGIGDRDDDVSVGDIDPLGAPMMCDPDDDVAPTTRGGDRFIIDPDVDRIDAVIPKSQLSSSEWKQIRRNGMEE
jgi:hypothetical protein